MKTEEVKKLLDKDITTLRENEKKDLIEKLKKVRNLKVTKNIALILVPTIMVASGMGILLDKEYDAFSDTYTVDYYSAYYQTEDEEPVKRDTLTKADNLEEYKYLLVKKPWKENKEENYYYRTLNYYSYDGEMDQEKADEIIDAGYQHVSEYGCELINSREEITTDKNYIEKTQNGEVEVSYLQKEDSKEFKNTKQRKAGLLGISSMLGFITALGMASIVNIDSQNQKIKNKLKDLGYEPKKKSLIKKKEKNNK